MILQSLVSLYDALADKGQVIREGWSIAKVSYGVVLDKNGQLTGLISLKQKTEDGKKEIAAQIPVPEQIKKTSGTASNFMCENAAYLFGLPDQKKTGNGNPGEIEAAQKKGEERFAAAKNLHHLILDGSESENAKRVLRFFDSWDMEKAQGNPYLLSIADDIAKGAFFVFEDETGFQLQKDSGIIKSWENYNTRQYESAETGRCLVTGETAPIAILHPSFRGVQGAQSSGASLVSFNTRSSESYGKEKAQGMNAPVSTQAAFKYGAALNYLFNDRKHIQHIGDTTIVYWAEDAEEVYQDAFGCALLGDQKEMTDEKLSSIYSQISRGGVVNEDGLQISYDNPFFVLGIEPNAGRLSVQFFLEDQFGSMLTNVMEHSRRLEIVRPIGEHKKLTLWFLLQETADQNSKDKNPPKPITGVMLTSILKNSAYPTSLYEMILLRIRAEHDINWRKAAIIKAYFLKNTKETEKIREVLTVSVNESHYEPYVFGRLFAVLEKVQKDANPGIKATIKDRYFTSAASTPASVFPLLISLSQHHLKKLSDGSQVYYDKLLTELQGKIEADHYPVRFSSQEQGAFYLGYYHEKQALYTKKESTEEVADHE